MPRTEILPVDHPKALERACHILQEGGLVAFPTDTLYGVGALVTNPIAIEHLYRIKGREQTKAIAILISDFAQLPLIVETMPPCAARLAELFWPGALTLVVPRKPSLPENLSPTMTIGVRMPNHAFAREMLRRSGPMAVTSANRSGAPDSLNASDVLSSIGQKISLIIDGGSIQPAIASTVVNCTLEPPVILRQGAIPENEIQQALEVDRTS
ncbi:MAG: threonylcarbamoyl-AMP synthase [Anaerolineae bacterium]|nr:threonylcarbamoyl-AMP synthase [Anaerolineae bacterium]